MKKLINVTLLLTAILMVAACGSKDAKKADSSEPEKKENAKSEEFTGEKYSKDAAIFYFIPAHISNFAFPLIINYILPAAAALFVISAVLSYITSVKALKRREG